MGVTWGRGGWCDQWWSGVYSGAVQSRVVRGAATRTPGPMRHQYITNVTYATHHVGLAAIDDVARDNLGHVPVGKLGGGTDAAALLLVAGRGVHRALVDRTDLL